MNYYHRHLGDYAKDTGHLSAVEHGVYTLLLDRYYSTERPIPQADAYKVARARTKDEQSAADGVLREFFKSIDGEWRHCYADRVIAKAQEKSDKAASSAAMRWQCERNANASQTHNGSHANGNAKAMLSNTPISNTPISKGKRRASRSPLPENFQISERVEQWAKAQGFDRLNEHCAAFRMKAAKAGYVYADWDSAFMDAIRKNWAELPKVSAPTLTAGEYD